MSFSREQIDKIFGVLKSTSTLLPLSHFNFLTFLLSKLQNKSFKVNSLGSQDCFGSFKNYWILFRCVLIEIISNTRYEKKKIICLSTKEWTFKKKLQPKSVINLL